MNGISKINNRIFNLIWTGVPERTRNYVYDRVWLPLWRRSNLNLNMTTGILHAVQRQIDR